ncbi:M14 family zinc carboxypeptidase [Oceanobacillus alkalisoli]|uniref:M14 family zinc carboxypeptidase n=1 Tax=Oceanobacillus alkalisoli TaxID=2925113 RepID=UPI001EEF9F9C|nr:M14 family zinc carboxypeptidase [Oceanobacillus alkalisoli]MCF3942849.1 peptidase M14 [Oceanobacillus alkalisoli]MCG5102427.1 peptidase M14 [Oceanobacillus alkalisoli]
MKRIGKFAMLSGAILLGAGIASPLVDSPVISQASEVKKPPVAGFISHDELTRELNQIERTSNGKVQVEVAGYSNQDREIYKTTVGTGEKVVFIQSEIHGNEKVGTVALLNMIKKIGKNNSPEMRQLREELTIVAMPMMNPDASEANRRGNEMRWEEVVDEFPALENASPTWNYYTYINQYWDYASNPGFDVNRDFNPDLDYVPQPEDFPGSSSQAGWYITPESQSVRDVYKDLQEQFGTVDVFIDLHHQGEYVIEGSGEPVTLSLSGVFVPNPDTAEGEKYSEYADRYNEEFSKQLNVAAYDALQQMGNSPFGNVSLYQQNLDLPGTALGSFSLNGSGTVLFEVTGQTQSFGQKKMGQLTKAVETGLYGILNSLATDEVYELNPEDYDDIPLTGR